MRLQASVCSYGLFCLVNALVFCRDWKIVICFSVYRYSKACLHFSAGFLSAVCRQACFCILLTAPGHRTASSMCAVRLLCLAGSGGFRGLPWVTTEMDFVQGFSLNLNSPPPLPEASMRDYFRSVYECVIIPVCLPQQGLTGSFFFFLPIFGILNWSHDCVKLSTS